MRQVTASAAFLTAASMASLSGPVNLPRTQAAHADLHAGELVGAQVGDDVFQAVVAPGGAAAADAELALGQGDVVRDDQDPLRGDLIEPGGLPHGFAGEVHVGHGLHQQDGLAAELGRVGQGLIFYPLDGDVGSVSQLVYHEEADVMAGPVILGTGVAQTDDDPLDRSGVLKRKHGRTTYLKKVVPYYNKCQGKSQNEMGRRAEVVSTHSRRIML